MKTALVHASKAQLLMEVQRLRELADTQTEKLHLQSERLEKQNRKLTAQQERIKELLRLIFGSRSERFSAGDLPEQLALFGDLEEAIEAACEAAEKETITYQRNKPEKHKAVRQPIPEDIPRKEIIIEPDFDTTGLKIIGQEACEELEYIPASFIVYCYIRHRYIDPNNEFAGVKIAPMPRRPIDKGIPGPALLARIAVDKFGDHIPFYRQAQRFKREGCPIAESTIEGWFRQNCELLKPLADRLSQKILETDYLMVDETGLKVQDLKKKGKTHLGFLWAYYAPRRKLALFDYRPGRGRQGPATMLKNFQGWLQTDGYSVYDDFEKRSGIQLVGCLAHARRYFERAQDQYPNEAGQMLRWMQKLYAVERNAREHELSPEQRYAIRIEHALPVYKQIKDWMVEQESNPAFMPKDLLGKAFRYLQGRFFYLGRYLEDGRLEIDNNPVENLIRPIAIGRKNYLFAGSHEGAKRAALMYSLLASCKLNGVDPFEYLRDILVRLPNHSIQKLDELLPDKWEPQPDPLRPTIKFS